MALNPLFDFLIPFRRRRRLGKKKVIKRASSEGDVLQHLSDE